MKSAGKIFFSTALPRSTQQRFIPSCLKRFKLYDTQSSIGNDCSIARKSFPTDCLPLTTKNYNRLFLELLAHAKQWRRGPLR
jgi:hypothetical protein